MGGNAGTGGGSQGSVNRLCTVNSDCVLVPVSCCGTCGAPTATDVLAINSDSIQLQSDLACANQAVPGCPLCAAEPNGSLLAQCVQGSCEVFDVRASPVSACETAQECVLRVAACCECGAAMNVSSLIALNADQLSSYAQLVCDSTADCMDCAPVYPSDITIDCISGHCQLAPSLAPGP
jgi:hypothetical protein